LRNVEYTSGRGNTLPYLYGYISETDWKNSPHFPYRVHFSKSKHPWPSEESEYIWASSYDVLPTTHDLLLISEEERIRVASTLLCSCGGGEYGIPCSLFRSYLCRNGMAKACCLNSGKPCSYHEECANGDDTYNRMESLAKAYIDGHGVRSKFSLLHPGSAVLPQDGNISEMPVLPNERCERKETEQEVYPTVSNILLARADQTLIPAMSKALLASPVVENKVSSSQCITIGSEPSTNNIVGIYTEKPPSLKRVIYLRRTMKSRIPEVKSISSCLSPQGNVSKQQIRKSTRNCKNKVFDDFVAMT
ncbi:hypothetical protein DICVIV_01976, partial [Dictyocaulus viviparus]